MIYMHHELLLCVRIPGMRSDDVCLVEQCWNCRVERLFRSFAAFLMGNIPRNLLIYVQIQRPSVNVVQLLYISET